MSHKKIIGISTPDAKEFYGRLEECILAGYRTVLVSHQLHNNGITVFSASLIYEKMPVVVNL